MYIFIYILKEILPKKIKNDYLWVIYIYAYIYIFMVLTCLLPKISNINM